MTRDQVWTVIVEQRLAVAGLLAGLDDEQWQQPSLCPAWTVREVAAHLTLQQLRVRDLPMILRSWRGDLARTTAEAARRRAAEWPPERLVADIRDTAGRHRRNLGVTYRDALIDILVHTQDIAIPLGLHHAMPPAAAAVAAQRVLTMRWPPPMPAVRRMAGFRLAADDTPWTFGAGPEVHGPAEALLLVTAGRRAALPRLSGPGAAPLAARLAG